RGGSVPAPLGSPAPRAHPSRYQYDKCQRFESHPETSVPFSRLDAPATTLRQINGIMTTFWITRSFIRMKSAARLAGSISVEAARQSRSDSSLRQRVVLRPCHLFSLDATSHDVNCSMKV